MRLNNSILSSLRESDRNKLDQLYYEVLNAKEMYGEANDEEDVFAGTEDSYAMEMLEQHLFDAIAYSGFFKDDTDPRIMPVYSKIMDLITSNANISKKDIEDAIKISGIKESTNGNAKVLDVEETGGGVISFVGEVGNYNFVGDIDGSVEFFDKKFGIDSWGKYTDIEDDAWQGKYGEGIQDTYDFEQKYAEFKPEYMPNIGRALKRYAKDVKNYRYREIIEREADKLINFKSDELNESASPKVDISKLNVTNGGWHSNGIVIYGPVKIKGKEYEVIFCLENDDLLCFKKGYDIESVLDLMYEGDLDKTYNINGKELTADDMWDEIYADCIDLNYNDRDALEIAINNKIYNEETGKRNFDGLNKVKLDEGAESKQTTFEEDPRNFTEEEKAEYGLNDEGIDSDGEQWLHCAWCGELVPLSECKKELNMGWICEGCQNTLYSRGEHPVYDENANFYDDIIEYEDSLKESATEDYWDAKEIKRDGFLALLKFNFGKDANGNNYIITLDNNGIKRLYAKSDEDAIKVYNKVKADEESGLIDHNFDNAYSKINEEEDIAKQKFMEYSNGKIRELKPVKIKASKLDFLWDYDDEDFDKSKVYTIRVNYVDSQGTKSLNEVDTSNEFGEENIYLRSDGTVIYGGEMDAGSLNHLMEFDWKYIDKDFYNDVIENWDSWEMSMRYDEEDLNESVGELHTVENDPAWAAAVAKVNAKYQKEKPEISEEIEKEYKSFVCDLLQSGYFTQKEIDKMPETKAYKEAIRDPENIWCECDEDNGSSYKPDGDSYLGVDKHGWICDKCKKYTQIG